MGGRASSAVLQDLMTPISRRVGPDLNRDTVADVLAVSEWTSMLTSSPLLKHGDRRRDNPGIGLRHIFPLHLLRIPPAASYYRWERRFVRCYMDSPRTSGETVARNAPVRA